VNASTHRTICSLTLLLPVFAGACDNVRKLPEANKNQAAIAARTCGLSVWEWSSGIYTFDGELDYPDHMGIAFSLDATGLNDSETQKISERVARTEECLTNSLAKQGVGANIAGSVSQTARATDEFKHAQTH
jgi:hypothetical protein